MKPMRVAIALIACVAVLSLSTLAAPPQQPTGVVQGTVVRVGTSEPVPNVEITLATDPVDPGAFEALRVAAGNATPYFDFVGPSTIANGDLGVLQALTDGAMSLGVSPLSGELVTMMNTYRGQTARFRALTDSRGEFSLTGVPAGTYTIRAARDGYFGEMARVVNVPAGPPVTASFSVQPGATVAGRVRGEDGDFIAGASVNALSVRYENGYPVLKPALTTKTNFRGEYRLFWLLPGEYVIAMTEDPPFFEDQPAPTYHPDTTEVARSTPVVVKPGDNIEGVDVQMHPGGKVRVSGTVVIPQSQTGNVIGYRVVASFRPSDPDSAIATYSTGRVQSGSGEIRFETSLPPGAYEAVVSVLPVPPAAPQPGPRMFPAPFSVRAPIEVRDRDLSVSLTATREVGFSGTLTIDGVPPGAPSPGARSRIRLAFVADASSRGEIQPGPEGRFGSLAQPGVRLRPVINGLPPDVYVSEVRKDGVNVFDDGLTFSADGSAIEIVAVSGAGIVEGMVRNSGGAPLRGATVVVVPEADRRQNKALFRSAKSDAKGQFTISSIAPGDYKLFAWESVPGDAFLSSRYLSRYEATGISVSVGKGSTTNKDLTAIPAGQ